MKVLFVCWRNVSRSQIAAGLYDHLTQSHDADSAGTEVERPGETLSERRKRVGGTIAIEVLQQQDIDIFANKTTQLRPEMLDRYDCIISMADATVTPVWLRTHKNYIFWKVTDPGARDIIKAAEARDDIKARIKEFIAVHAQPKPNK